MPTDKDIGDNPLDVLVPGTHYKAYLVASLALTSTPVAAIDHYGLTAEQVSWAEQWYLDNGPAIYDAIWNARRLGHEMGAEYAAVRIARMRGTEDEEKLEEVEAGVIVLGVRHHLEFGGAMFEALAERYHVKRLVVIDDILEGKLPVGRPLVFLYDPGEGHTVSDYIHFARALQDMMGYATCVLNRDRLIEEMDEAWERWLDLASYRSSQLVPASEDA